MKQRLYIAPIKPIALFVDMQMLKEHDTLF